MHTHRLAPTDLVDPRAVLRARRRTAPLRAVSGLAWKRIPVTHTRLPLYEGWNCAFNIGLSQLDEGITYKKIQILTSFVIAIVSGLKISLCK